MKLLDANAIAQLSTREAIAYGRRVALDCMAGIAVPVYRKRVDVNCALSPALRFQMIRDNVTIDGKTMLRSEKVVKFNNKAKMTRKVKPQDGTKGQDDLSIIRTGKPGSKERLDAYQEWNDNNGEGKGETSPFVYMEE
jgi:hypothetical protein